MKEKEVLDKFAKFACLADEATFRTIFGDILGGHLWEKLVNLCQRDFLRLYSLLDYENRTKLAEYLK